MQLTFINKLYEQDSKDRSLVLNILRIINNMKFLRVRFEERMGSIDQNSKEFKKLAFAADKVGYCLYWLAVMGHQYSKHLSEYSDMSQDSWYEKTYDKGYKSVYEPRSLSQVYDYLLDVESLSKRFKMAYINQLEKSPTHNKLLNFYFDSLNDMKTTIKEVL